MVVRSVCCMAGVREERVVPKGVHTSVDLTSPWSPCDGIIEEFPFDNEVYTKFKCDEYMCNTCIVSPVAIWFGCWCVQGPILPTPWCIQANFADEAYCRWLAISHENIYIVRRKRKTGCRFDFQDAGEVRKIIPISEVQDIMIIQPAGAAVCCFVPNVLSQTSVQTAAHGGGDDPHHDGSLLSLAGLEDPERFRAAVMRIKSSGAVAPTDAAPAQQGMDSIMQRTLEEILATVKSIDEKLGNCELRK